MTQLSRPREPQLFQTTYHLRSPFYGSNTKMQREISSISQSWKSHCNAVNRPSTVRPASDLKTAVNQFRQEKMQERAAIVHLRQQLDVSASRQHPSTVLCQHSSKQHEKLQDRHVQRQATIPGISKSKKLHFGTAKWTLRSPTDQFRSAWDAKTLQACRASIHTAQSRLAHTDQHKVPSLGEPT